MLYINGEWKEAYSGNKLDVYNPATGELIDSVASGGKEEAKEAIQAAKEAFKTWKKATGQEKGKYLAKVAAIMKERVDQLAETITLEMGKPLPDAKREVLGGISYVEWYAEEAKRVYGETIPASHPNKHLMVLRQPVGVTAAITPWNFPVSMITRKIAPAIAAGCTVVLKPAPDTPISAIKVFECFHEAGLPKGVANLVVGNAEEIGSEMTESSDVRKLTFTGSTPVGKLLLRNSANTVKKVSMELGGHAPLIVFEDADIGMAIKGVLGTKFKNSGQTCISTNRVYVHESIAEEFGQKLAEATSNLKIGNGIEAGIDVGPLINSQALEKVESHVSDAVERNGKVLCGGNRYDTDGNGTFYEPTVINYATEQMKISTEETFGPVAPIFTFKDEEEIIERANHVSYGLAAYCFTNDLGRGYRMMEELEYGIVGINDPAPIVAQAPFGGVKESGIGKEGGRSGLTEYLEEKFVSVGTAK
ncbi:succinate-semialdehyde dehydrogenase / glutarate-semialdehyde dehydrogenase [Thalassobacillus cyri]|uniref:Succinate-semialdehyde dehydrogenase / glutarate-semialdehyde dehydrogenase n=1 Tax=Thalassobacillus cyri TaxID=571932 RepID=A0A1H3ZJ66_9BACI|nr:NAD-dependent succinate-semialdehyde dehydrogenase [Thalassobacillus cyri]SEA23773.1 succinate-semialdehyde dehydrogenase / glutarate-semialdehyde dehydrogenase [Thalassobacillus cyri]